MSVALHYMPYTAGSLAARNGPSGTRGGFSYTVPSPSSTASSCSLRLSGAKTSQQEERTSASGGIAGAFRRGRRYEVERRHQWRRRRAAAVAAAATTRRLDPTRSGGREQTPHRFLGLALLKSRQRRDGGGYQQQ